MVERIAATIELEGQEAKLRAQLDVEGRGCFDPTPAQTKRCVAVPIEHLGLHLLSQACGGQVVAYVREPEACRNADGSARRREEDRLGHAPGATRGEHAACPEPVGCEHRGV